MCSSVGRVGSSVGRVCGVDLDPRVVCLPGQCITGAERSFAVGARISTRTHVSHRRAAVVTHPCCRALHPRHRTLASPRMARRVLASARCAAAKVMAAHPTRCLPWCAGVVAVVCSLYVPVCVGVDVGVGVGGWRLGAGVMQRR